jgi:pilus assembly protein TadC
VMWAAALLALALVLMPTGGRLRARLSCAAAQPQKPPVHDDPLAVASSLEVFAACLSAGMPTARAASAASGLAPPSLAEVLRRAAELLALGAHPGTAWAGQGEPQVAALLRLARRSAASGAALAQGVAELAEQSRADTADAAEAAAQRASVLIAGPLGVCYLPAFVCLGIVPVIAGLATDVLQSGVL